MIHPPTISHGPLQAHEVAELAESADDLEVWIEDLDDGACQGFCVRGDPCVADLCIC